jgi:hypothetical protein
MPQETKKSYNLPNIWGMWGSWVGLVIGVLVVFNSFVSMYGNNPIQFVYILNPFFLLTNLVPGMLPDGLASDVAITGLLLTFLTTPIVFALYGWGIHSIFRKFSK